MSMAFLEMYSFDTVYHEVRQSEFVLPHYFYRKAVRGRGKMAGISLTPAGKLKTTREAHGMH